MVFTASQVWARLVAGASLGARITKNGLIKLDWTEAITRVIDLGTFASIWYWLVVIVAWSVASNWLIGIPFDMLIAARKYEAGPLADLSAVVDVNVRRIVRFDDVLGVWLVGLCTFVLSGLATSGFLYGFEFAQGAFVLGAPLALVGLLNLRLARELGGTPLAGPDLVKRLYATRLWTQVIAAVALFVTAMYGMYFNLDLLLFF